MKFYCENVPWVEKNGIGTIVICCENVPWVEANGMGTNIVVKISPRLKKWNGYKYNLL